MALKRVLEDDQLHRFRTWPCERLEALWRDPRGQNVCGFGAQCQYSHEVHWVRRSPVRRLGKQGILYGPKICPRVTLTKTRRTVGVVEFDFVHLQNDCNAGRECPFSHTREEQFYHPKLYKTIMCPYLATGPSCPHHYCPCAHSMDELREREESIEELALPTDTEALKEAMPPIYTHVSLSLEMNPPPRSIPVPRGGCLRIAQKDQLNRQRMADRYKDAYGGNRQSTDPYMPPGGTRMVGGGGVNVGYGSHRGAYGTGAYGGSSRAGGEVCRFTGSSYDRRRSGGYSGGGGGGYSSGGGGGYGGDRGYSGGDRGYSGGGGGVGGYSSGGGGYGGSSGGGGYGYNYRSGPSISIGAGVGGGLSGLIGGSGNSSGGGQTHPITRGGSNGGFGGIGGGHGGGGLAIMTPTPPHPMSLSTLMRVLPKEAMMDLPIPTINPFYGHPHPHPLPQPQPPAHNHHSYPLAIEHFIDSNAPTPISAPGLLPTPLAINLEFHHKMHQMGGGGGMDAHTPMAAHNNNNPFPHTMPLSVYALEGEWVDRFPEPPVIPPFTPSCINTPKSTNTATNMKKKILNKPVAKKHVEFVCADETNLSTAENSGDEGNKHDDDDFDYDEFDQTYNCTNYVSASYTTGTTAPLIEYAYTMPVHQTPMPYQFPAANSPFPPLLDTPHTYEFPHFTGALPPPPPMYTNTNTNMQFMAHTLTPRPPPPPPPPPMDDTDTVVQTAHPYEVVHQCVPMVPKVEEIADNEYAEGEGEGQGEDHNNGSDGSDGSGGLQEDTESKEEGSNN